MKDLFLNIYRGIVGGECGFTGEGNEQWYYTLALVINLMLVWWLKPEVALVFTILAVIHYLTVVIYGVLELFGFFDFENIVVPCAYVYLGIHVTLLLIAIFTSFKWTIITMAITIVAFVLAPDSTGHNIFPIKKSYSKLSLLFNTIIFAAFVVIDFLLPIKLWIKILFIIVALIIHPIIDYLEGECIIISDITFEVFDNIV